MKTATKPKPKALPRPGEDSAMDVPVLAQLAAMQRLSVNEMKAKWEALFGTPGPNNARAFLELRIGYGIQEMTYGCLTRETSRVLYLLAYEVEGKLGRKHMSANSRNPVGDTVFATEPLHYDLGLLLSRMVLPGGAAAVLHNMLGCRRPRFGFLSHLRFSD